MKNIMITGAGGFIGSHLAERLKSEGNYIIGVDIKYPEFKNHLEICNEFYIIDFGISDFYIPYRISLTQYLYFLNDGLLRFLNHLTVLILVYS